MNIGKIYKIPLNEKTAYIAGVIIGDGNISNATKSKEDKSPDYRITIELAEKGYLLRVTSLIKSIIKTRSQVVKRKPRERKQQHYYFQFRNKSFYYFLTKDLGIPAGNKCSSVQVPKIIFKNPNLYWSFLAGLFDTDGGIRSNTIGFTSSSNELISGTGRILKNLKISYNTESWVNKKYNKEYYGLKINKKSTDRFLNNIPMKNYEKQKKVFRHVGVPERSNGLDNFLNKIKN